MAADGRKGLRIPADLHADLKAQAECEDLTLVETLRLALRCLAQAGKWNAVYNIARAESTSETDGGVSH